jgi:hypothetical protein
LPEIFSGHLVVERTSYSLYGYFFFHFMAKKNPDAYIGIFVII